MQDQSPSGNIPNAPDPHAPLDAHEEHGHDHEQQHKAHDHNQSEHEHLHEDHDHNRKDHEQEHGHEQAGHGHGHEHGRVDADLYGNRAGLRAVQIATAGMLLVSLVQLLIAVIGGSAGLFADALHNLGDVLTTVALWIAFVVSNRAANRQYTYGYYRAEDLAGIFIVLVIIASAAAGAVESILKLTSGNVPTQLYLSMAAAAIGCLGNEILAQYKISVGRRINSVPLVADGQHSRIDGLTSLAALLGLLGVKLGWQLADPLAGILITLVILGVVYSTSRSVLRRLLDAVDPHMVPGIVEVASAVEGVEAVTEVKARWLG
ncbi:MAG: cation diffusion facilitator family transporter, partial [Ktedonobacteraceae bacterium]